MICDPMHITRELSAVRSQTLLREVDFGAGNTKTKALELTRNSLSDKRDVVNGTYIEMCGTTPKI